MILSLKKRIQVKNWTSEEKVIMCKETENGYEQQENIEDNNILLIETKDGYEIIVEVNNITLEAKIRDYFEKVGERLIVTLEPNGADGDKEEKEVRKGFKIKLEGPSYTRSGYNFVGWCEDKEGNGTRYLAGSEYKVEKDAKLYAIWEVNTVTITLMANNGTEEQIEKTVSTNEEATLPTNTFTREGYYFINWNTQADGTGTTYENGGLITISENLTLYAQWETKITATMSFKVNDVNGVNKLTEGTKIVIGATALSSGIQKVELKIGNYTMYSEETSGKTYTKEISLNELTGLENLLFYSKNTATLTVTSVNNNSEQVSQSDVQNFTVGSAVSLKQLATVVNGGNTLEGETVLQIADIDLSTVCSSSKGTWNPIGYATVTSRYYFNGRYNGNNKKIINLYIYITEDKTVGLFGLLGEKGKIEKITLDGNVTSQTSGSLAAGGICGRCQGIIESCTNNANVVNNMGSTGGVSGNVQETGMISNSVNNGEIITKSSRAGGITGETFANINNCKNNGNVTSQGNETPDKRNNVQGTGGIAGRASNKVTISNSSNTGDITATKAYYVGGIVGFGKEKVTISECYNYDGNISAGGNAGGGIVGASYGVTIINCYNYLSSTNNYIKVSGTNVGGIVGTISGGSEYKTYITNCYNIGENISGTPNGAIVGVNAYNSEIKNCYYLSTSTLSGIGSILTTPAVNNITKKEVSYFTSAVTNTTSVAYLLNENSTSGVWAQSSSINGGYPYLK